MTAVTLGPEGTYSHRATNAIADGDEIDFRQSVTAIVDAVAAGEYDRGVIPIENNIEGSVTESLDAIADYDIAVVREIVTPIRHALLAQGPEFDTVASHSQALAQCRTYLEREYPDATLEAVASTAQGVDFARDDPSVAGIGHPALGGDELEVLARTFRTRTRTQRASWRSHPLRSARRAAARPRWWSTRTRTIPVCCSSCSSRSPIETST